MVLEPMGKTREIRTNTGRIIRSYLHKITTQVDGEYTAKFCTCHLVRNVEEARTYPKTT